MRFWAKVEIQKLIELLLKDFKRQAAPFGLQVTTLWGRDNIKAIVSACSISPPRHQHVGGLKAHRDSP